MQKLLLLIFSVLISANSFGEYKTHPWLSMNPINSCQEVVLQYYPKEETYDIRIAKPDGKSFYIETEIKDLNDLSALTEILNQAVNDYCPVSKLDKNTDYSEALCPPLDTYYSDSYVRLIEHVSAVVNKDRRSVCDNIIPYIKLQSEVEQLESKELIKIKKTKNILEKILRLITDKETDKMIDHFNTCGGKKGSEKFVKNLILLEVKNACAAPKPPGLLSWEDAERIAEEVASDYKKTSLIKLNGKTKDITRDTMLKFADFVTKDEVGSLLKPYMDEKNGDPDKQVNEFINNLDSYKKLQETKTDRITDYVSYVYATDVGVEVGKKALPLLIESNFAAKLPESWSEERKREFIDNKLLKKANDTYDNCMAEEIEYASMKEVQDKKFGFKINKEKKADENLIDYRLTLKERYCDKNPEECNQTCGGSVNMFSDSKGASDTERIQGCVLKGITQSIEPLLYGIIHDQKEEFKENFDLTNQMANDFSEKTWNTLIGCVNRRIEKDTKSSTPVDILNNDSHLQKISTDNFQKYILNCADLAESKVSREFVSQLLLNEKTLVDTFNRGAQRLDEYGNSHNTELEAKVNEITNISFTPCVEKQYTILQLKQESGLKDKDPMLCTPIVEMNASLLVVKEELNNMLLEKNLQDNPELKLIVKEYEACGDSAITSAINDIGSLTSQTPLNTTEDSKHYLEKNENLFNCVNNAIGKISYVIAGTEFDKIIEEQKGKVKNPKYLESLKPMVKDTIKACFNDGLNNLSFFGYLVKDENGNDIRKSIEATSLSDAEQKLKGIEYTSLKKQGKWQAFTSFNEVGGLDKLQISCEEKATGLVVPKLILKEATSELKPLLKTEFLKDDKQIEKILKDSVLELNKKYSLDINWKQSPKAVKEEILAKGLKVHIQKGGDMDSYIEEVSGIIEKNTIKEVHGNLQDQILAKTWNINQKSKFSTIPDYFPASCLQDIYNKFMKDEKADPNSEPMTLGDLSSYLQKGFSFLEEKNPANFWNEMKELKKECNNIDKYKTAKDFNHSKFYDIIVRAQIYEEFKGEFKAGIMKSITDMEKDLKDPHKSIKQKYIDQMKSEMEDLLDKNLTAIAFNNNIFNDSKVMDFAKNNLDKLLDSDPKTKETLTTLLLSKMFEDKNSGGFADKFTQIQVEGNFGIEGVEQAFNEAKEGTSLLWGAFTVGKSAGAKAAIKYFNNPKNLKKVIDWNKIDIKERNAMTQAMYYDAILESQNERKLPPKIESDVFNALNSKGSRTNAFLNIGESLFNQKIDKLTDNVTNGYQNYEANIKKEAENYAKDLYYLTPGIKEKYTKAQLTSFIESKIKENHMERNLTDRLLGYDYGGKDPYPETKGTTVTDKIKEDISDLGSDIFWGKTPEQKKAKLQRQIEKAKNPWPTGPKW